MLLRARGLYSPATEPDRHRLPVPDPEPSLDPAAPMDAAPDPVDLPPGNADPAALREPAVDDRDPAAWEGPAVGRA